MDKLGKAVGIGAIALACVAAPVGLIFWSGGIQYLTAPFRGAVQEQEITNRGAYRIQAYEQFYGWQEQIQAIDQKLDAYVAPLDPRMRTECIGLLSARANLASRYNAAARSVETQGQWMADDLPERIRQEAPKSC